MRVVFLVACVLFTFYQVKCLRKAEEEQRPLPVADTEERSEYDLSEIMNECNETFRIEMIYIESLNTSGSFPDETDKTPKCYVRCVLERSLVASEDGQFDADRTADVFAGMRSDTPLDTVKQMAAICSERSETCKCERAYQFLRCLIQMEIENEKE
ncbi:general odorant-binding protein 84a-like [Zerene cesonia]|uniref:general odorant-binding protein 84a-like n=1 Tax=Zerene cesonia TaxID=33412 RepID=UPI0018E542ED|nr:general odorant-binding protein 84a-like [Zerene cesonia]